MKKLITLFFLISALSTHASAFNLSGKDCTLQINKLLYTQTLYLGFWNWGTYGVLSNETMTLSQGPSATFNVSTNEFDAKAEVTIKQNKAYISIKAPHVNHNEVVTLPQNQDGFYFSRSASYKNYSTKSGFTYEVRCNLGLTEEAKQGDQEQTAKMDAMGPAAEWSDPSAASVATLPVGTILQLKEDMHIGAGSDPLFVEYNGLMTNSDFLDLEMPFRFAFAKFRNANNGYTNPAFYPQGMKLMVVGIQRQAFTSGGQQYTLKLQTLSDANLPQIEDPIVYMDVDGRRSGGHDIKIPQLAEVLKSKFDLILP